MGSGHILVYAFDLLMQIYRKQGYTDRDAAESIVRNNLFGLDIDDRAAQLAYFAVMMKALQYDKRFLRRDIQPNLCAIQESNGIEAFDKLQGQMNLSSVYMQAAGELITQFKDAKTYGSLLSPQLMAIPVDLMQHLEQACGYDLETMEWYLRAQDILPSLIRQGNILTEKYDVVVTNPPYLNKLESNLKSFVQAEHKDYSADLFSVFIYRNFAFCKANGYSALMTPFVWMFIKSYEKLREYIISEKSIASLIQLEYSAFEEATVPLCTFVLRNSRQNYSGVYLRLTDFRGGMAVQDAKVLEALEDPDCKFRYTAQQENFTKVPGSPIAYWVSERVFRVFEYPSLSSIAEPRQGLATGENARFVRLWHEIGSDKRNFSAASGKDAKESGKKWFPYNKGGDFRKWYGNNDFVVNWENDGDKIRNYKDEDGKLRSRPQNIEHFFKQSITWSKISSGDIAFRYKPTGHIFDVAGTSIFVIDDLMLYLLAFCNTKVALRIANIISPTLNYEVGHIASFPVMIENSAKTNVETLAEMNIEISKDDWDSFETSWDFSAHPLLRGLE